ALPISFCAESYHCLRCTSLRGSREQEPPGYSGHGRVLFFGNKISCARFPLKPLFVLAVRGSEPQTFCVLREARKQSVGVEVLDVCARHRPHVRWNLNRSKPSAAPDRQCASRGELLPQVLLE